MSEQKGEIDRARVERAMGLPPRISAIPLPPEALPAAVLVLVKMAPARAVLQVRARHLRDHGGELGFPGGKPEAGDADLLATALREAHEELGVAPASLTPLGRLATIPVITGRFVVHPFVALAPGDLAFVPSPELERLIELPLAPWVEGRAAVYATVDTWRGATFTTPFFRLEGGEILYGASAVIFYDLLDRVARAGGGALPEPTVVEGKPWGDRYGREVTLTHAAGVGRGAEAG